MRCSVIVGTVAMVVTSFVRHLVDARLGYS
jgi:hypothetical protein